VSSATAPSGPRSRALIAHPGNPFVTYVQESFARLKAEQQHLLAIRV
jgi:hypothetical protein